MEESINEWLAALPLGAGVTFVQSDRNGLIALNKPAGVRSHPNNDGADPGALLVVDYESEAEAYHWRDANGKLRKLYLLNRLDAPTSGLILLAANPECAEAVRSAFKDHTVEKTYLARVFGNPHPPKGRWDDRLRTQRTREGLRSQLGSGPPARTRYQTLASAANNHLVTNLLALHPETGRTHQLRVQCQGHGVPIVGDQTYGDFVRNRQFFSTADISARLLLHAWRIRVPYTLKGERFTFAAEAVPPALLQPLGGTSPESSSAEPPQLKTRRFKRPG